MQNKRIIRHLQKDIRESYSGIARDKKLIRELKRKGKR
jgi:hypothetical protein